MVYVYEFVYEVMIQSNYINNNIMFVKGFLINIFNVFRRLGGTLFEGEVKDHISKVPDLIRDAV
jgi:hypothetical protein